MRSIRPIHRSKTALALVLVTVGGLALSGCADTGETAFCPVGGDAVASAGLPAPRFVAPTSAEDVLAWADREPNRQALRRLAASLPPDMGEVPSAERKRAFVAIVLPLAHRLNAAILDDRRFVEKAMACGDGGHPLSPAAQARLEGLDAAYDAGGDLSKLHVRLDTVPVSLLLAQAAIESGWGTSRFAMKGNALFGQRTTAADRGMQPQGLDEDASVRVAAFPHLLASVRAYVHNLNTQPAYRAFRQRRAALRSQGRQPDGLDLASALASYSERGVAYVSDLKTIIRGNGFGDLDDTPRAVAERASDA